MPIEQTTRSDSVSQGHTPGPWVLDRHGTIWAYGDGLNDGTCLIADIFDADPEHNSLRSDMAQANRRLIALSPEMLDLLGRVEGYLAFEKSKQGRALYVEARTLGLKARGGAA